VAREKLEHEQRGGSTGFEAYGVGGKGRTLKFSAGLAAIGVVGLASLTGAAGSAGATTSVVRVDGIYRIVSTDCYFSAGRCTARFDIEQRGDLLSDSSDRLFHGHIRGDHVAVGETFPPGTSEDSWAAFGTTSNGGRTFHGSFVDGIGGSGTFTATFLFAG
jgi:hypothetical protein